MTSPKHPEPHACADEPDLGALAAVGDGHSLALVGPEGGVEWFCPRRFDAAPLFWPLLDRNRGGHLKLAAGQGPPPAIRYLDDSAVLELTFDTAAGTARALLGMLWPAEAGRQRLVWLVEGLSGVVDLSLVFEPAQAWSDERLDWSPDASGQQLRAQGLALQAEDVYWRRDGDGWRATRAVRAGERFVVQLQVALDAGPTTALDAVAVQAQLGATVAAWRDWSARLRCPPRYRELLVRSAITLKLLIYQPTGAVVAAATCSLPESPGGERNWDYRYTWFRDAGLTLAALFSLGCHDEAHRWAQWLQDTVERQGMPLNILYTVDGLPAPGERVVEGVDGYRGARPVRVGNAADTQRQLDIYGELLECVHACDEMQAPALRAHWPHLCLAADFIAAHWRAPGQGIWEVRSAARHFVHSKVMAWAGLQRALWLQRRHGLQADVARWQREAEAIRRDVLDQGLAAHGQHFVRAYGEPGLDAALLLIARSGFVEDDDPRFRATVRAVREQLSLPGRPWLLRRYHPADPDGVAGDEGAFLICSFWLVEALARLGEQAEAEALFEQLRDLAGRHGLYAEEVDPATGALLGNLPQAFSHVGLINAALRLAGEPRPG